ncbi:hypothetical protein HY572_04305 [Candidatus Micrarchaeota archaeon]|nr:hypothetical protein [Candidatus Micrarchaeota archaeon]
MAFRGLSRLHWVVLAIVFVAGALWYLSSTSSAPVRDLGGSASPTPLAVSDQTLSGTPTRISYEGSTVSLERHVSEDGKTHTSVVENLGESTVSVGIITVVPKSLASSASQLGLSKDVDVLEDDPIVLRLVDLGSGQNAAHSIVLKSTAGRDRGVYHIFVLNAKMWLNQYTEQFAELVQLLKTLPDNVSNDEANQVSDAFSRILNGDGDPAARIVSAKEYLASKSTGAVTFAVDEDQPFGDVQMQLSIDNPVSLYALPLSNEFTSVLGLGTHLGVRQGYAHVQGQDSAFGGLEPSYLQDYVKLVQTKDGGYALLADLQAPARQSLPEFSVSGRAELFFSGRPNTAILVPIRVDLLPAEHFGDSSLDTPFDLIAYDCGDLQNELGIAEHALLTKAAQVDEVNDQLLSGDQVTLVSSLRVNLERFDGFPEECQGLPEIFEGIPFKARKINVVTYSYKEGEATWELVEEEPPTFREIEVSDS